jgi:hypothetical protein
MGGLLEKKNQKDPIVANANKIGKDTQCPFCNKVFHRMTTFGEFNKHLEICKKDKEKVQLENLLKDLRETNNEHRNLNQKHYNSISTTRTNSNMVSQISNIGNSVISKRGSEHTKIHKPKKEIAKNNILVKDTNSGLLLFDSNFFLSRSPKKETAPVKNKQTIKHIEEQEETQTSTMTNSPFEMKIENFKKKLKDLKIDWTQGACTLNLTRDNILQQSISEFAKINPYKELKINFKGEVSHDAGGLIREWYTVIFKEIQSRNLSNFLFIEDRFV